MSRDLSLVLWLRGCGGSWQGRVSALARALVLPLYVLAVLFGLSLVAIGRRQ